MWPPPPAIMNMVRCVLHNGARPLKRLMIAVVTRHRLNRRREGVVFPDLRLNGEARVYVFIMACYICRAARGGGALVGERARVVHEIFASVFAPL